MAQFPCPSCAVLMAPDKLTCVNCGYRLKIDRTTSGSHGIEEELRIPEWMLREVSLESGKRHQRRIPFRKSTSKNRTIEEIGSQVSYSNMQSELTAEGTLSNDVTLERKRLYNAYALILVSSTILLGYFFRVPLSKYPQILPDVLLGLCCIVTLVCLKFPRMNQSFLFKPARVWEFGEVYRFLTAGLAHLNLTHLLLNGFALYNFGPYLLSFLIGQYGFFGPCIFIVFFYSVIVLADIPDLVRHRKNRYYSSVGASGGIAGIIAASAIAYPGVRISLGFSVNGEGIVAPVYVAGYLLISIIFAFGRRSKIAHLTHAAGTIIGLIVMFLFSSLQGLDMYRHLIPTNSASITSSAVANSSLLNRLSVASGSKWKSVSISGAESTNILNIYTHSDCVVWDFPTKTDAENAMKSDNWQGLTRYTTDIDATTYVVLRATRASSNCAQAARKALGWGSLD